ncbi:MAG: phenylalanine--tRNA ligase subunit beta [Deltaproteobacteria bacterium CG11_big_fil_rev_8_21_14_0_20_49_13]|nr:MAG: phenylalanine--tRNA ligase subunit beta [Deltaproteobacteria bacterium CG11_big_fil_rev_8_21_14_0_20_49_13]
MLVTLNWLKEFVDIRIKPEELAHRLTMGGFEVEGVASVGDDTVFELNITPNRGDCLSLIGVAREVAAITGSGVKRQETGGRRQEAGKKREGSRKSVNNYLTVEVKDKERCQRYAAKVIDGVRIAQSPEWLSKRLGACGIRSINNVVDATNYVMLETGQPFHAFDHRFIRGKKIVVDTPKRDIDFVTLDGITRKILKEDLLINDAEGPVALAGVMGGANSEVKPDTTTIVLESACFNPVSVRRTAKRLGLPSESSRRFEKGIDPSATVQCMNRLASLIVSIAGGEPTTDHIDVYPKKLHPIKVRLNFKEVNRLLGISIKAEYIKKCFKNLGIVVTGDTCTIPTFRPDLTRSADLIEEVARLYGFDKIPVSVPLLSMESLIKPSGHDRMTGAREFLNATGFYEAINYGFCSPTELEPFTKEIPYTIENPLGVEFSAMKTSLISGLVNNLRLNLNLGQTALRLFEIRPVFLKDGEVKKLTGLVYGSRSQLNWSYRDAPVDFYDIKGTCEGLLKHLGISNIEFRPLTDISFMHPQATSLIYANDHEIGFCGLLHPAVNERWDIKEEIYVFDIYWDFLIAALSKEKRSFKPLEKFPSVRRDVALLLNEDVPAGGIKGSIEEFKSHIIKDSLPFDVYKGKGIPEGKKSVAFAVIYSDPERTLTDEEVNDTHTKLIGYLKGKLGAEVR